MAGPHVDVHISQEALASSPHAWVLTTPQSAVRSFLDWTSYAYRIATSDVATPTMGANQEVRVASYVQYNLEKQRLLDELLTSITIGNPTAESTHTVVPTHEEWTYSYLSIGTGNKVIGGPYSASYEVTYTVVKTAKGSGRFGAGQGLGRGQVIRRAHRGAVRLFRPPLSGSPVFHWALVALMAAHAGPDPAGAAIGGRLSQRFRRSGP
jgi:hypothetical protein